MKVKDLFQQVPVSLNLLPPNYHTTTLERLLLPAIQTTLTECTTCHSLASSDLSSNCNMQITLVQEIANEVDKNEKVPGKEVY